jgi:protein-tyrosine phosphatase
MSSNPISSDPTLQDIKNAQDGHLPKGPTPPPPPMPDPEPLPPWALRRPLLALWFMASRAGDHGRWTPFRRLTHITRHMYLGGQITLRGWRTLEKWGVGALVNMRVEWDDRKLGIQTPYYLWLPTIDGTPSTVEQLARGAQFIHEQANAGRSVYIHCAAGLGRSPTQVIAYMMTRGTSMEDAIDFVLQRRPFVQLSPKQKQRLAQFAEYIVENKIDHSEDRQTDPEQPPTAAAVDVPARGKDS